MFYEERPRQRGRRRRGGIIRFLLRLLFKLLALLLVAAAVAYALPVGLFLIDSESSFSPAAGLKSSRINVLLLGVDVESQDAQRSDTIIVASIGYNTCRLTSVMRDTVADIPGHGKQKINAAYNYGGAALTAQTLNRNFGLNITKYVVIDFIALAEILNAMGGVDVRITRAEQDEINENMKSAWRKVFSKAGYDPSVTGFLDLDFSGADADGCVCARLDGFQALNYARIRKLDSDYTRTYRQRKLISAIVQRAKSVWYNPVAIVRVIKQLSRRLVTNLNPLEIVSLALKVVFSQPDGLRLPVDGTYTDDGSSLSNVDYAANLEAFKKFVYD